MEEATNRCSRRRRSPDRSDRERAWGRGPRMVQQVSWHCEDCETAVTVVVASGGRSPRCPHCGRPKDAAEEPARDPAPAGLGETSDSAAAAAPGPRLDRVILQRVFGRSAGPPFPPFSTEDWTATALAEAVGRRPGWSFHLAACGRLWTATFLENTMRQCGGWSPFVSSLICATGRTRALAICRALLKVTRCPRWSPLDGGAIRLPARPLPLPSSASL